MPIRVLIVDQHEIMRAGIKLTCSDRNELEFVGEASSLAEGLQVASATNPDVAIVDPDCDGVDGLDGLRPLLDKMSELKILVFTAYDDPDYATRIMDSGACGYLIKVAGWDEIAVAIRSVHLGRNFISHTHHGVTVPKSKHAQQGVAFAGSGLRETSKSLPLHQLSSREQEVLTLLVDGMTNKQVAERLFLSVKTVETYRARIMKKYGLRDRAELVQFARKTFGAIVHAV
jgi:DNA-binding NarL/FixJ family response regulator